MLNVEYNNFFIEIQKFKEKQKEQKQRGLNNYNMVNIVRSETSEVGMHSNIIYSLINPDGLHYQGDLFLQHFIEDVLEFDNNFGANICVNVEESTYENRRIDFTIKSDKYYIGIEMKVNAPDSPNQIEHYYRDLCKKAEEDKIDRENVIIYYLTKNGKSALDFSYGEYTEYRKISFKEQIMNWIDSCQKEVRNITNLNEAFNNYRDIVKKITDKTYKGNIMQLEDEDFFMKNLDIAKDIHDAYIKAKNKNLENFIFKLTENLTEKLSLKPIKEGSKILITIKENSDYSLKLQIVYEGSKLLATLFKYKDGWQKGVYTDNPEILGLINSIKNIRGIGIHGYFSMNVYPNFSPEVIIHERIIDESTKNIVELLESLNKIDI